MHLHSHTESIAHALFHATGFGKALEGGRFEGLDRDLVLAILDEAGRFAEAEIATIDRIGDTEGCTYDTERRSVSMPPGWKEAYAAFREAGWAAAPGDPEHGGQGMPLTLAVALQEIWNAASVAFGLCTLLTQGACETLATFGSEELKSRYLPHMISGDWSGAMCLTEPQAGSDLSTIRTMAEPDADGTWRLSGQKIFISFGEHDLTENIVHLVLARTPDAPPGTRGLSLFLVPKVLEDGRRNAVFATGLEHKMGLHGSPTVPLSFEGARGWLIGERHRGLAQMFVMMNNARLHVGVQGVGVAEHAWRKALAFALERRQGRRPGREGQVPIVEHPDVRRMLLDSIARTAAARCICLETAFALDMTRLAEGENDRRRHAAHAALMTPLAKAFSTDTGVEVADAAVQIHGGMGYMEETGAAQLLRDARILPIYEGTNGIQALDLVHRKILMEDGLAVRRHMDGIARLVRKLKEHETLAETGMRLGWALQTLGEAMRFMEANLKDGGERPSAVAVPFLRLHALVAGGAGLARMALGTDDAAHALLARHYMQGPLAETAALKAVVMGTADTIGDEETLRLLVEGRA